MRFFDGSRGLEGTIGVDLAQADGPRKAFDVFRLRYPPFSPVINEQNLHCNSFGTIKERLFAVARNPPRFPVSRTPTYSGNPICLPQYSWSIADLQTKFPT
jgi:hypothetical protein